MTDPVDFTKIDPLVREYLADLRETLKKTQAEAKQVALERDAYRQELDTLKKANAPDQIPDFRTLSPKDYEQALRDMKRKAVLTRYDEKLKNAFGDSLKDARSLSPEEYIEWKMKATGRKAW